MRWLCLSTFIAILFFYLFPRLDLAFSGLFYHGGFALEWHPVVRGIYISVRYVTMPYVLVLLAIALCSLCGKKLLPWRSWCYLVLVLLVGPLFVIEVVSKDYMNRPRPRNVIEFGGAMDYVPPLSIGNQSGRSFVSNHAAAGFYIVAFAFLLRGQRRRWMYAGGVFLGTAIGMVRVMQGGHFASDIIFAGLIMLWIIHLLAWSMLRERKLI